MREGGSEDLGYELMGTFSFCLFGGARLWAGEPHDASG